MGRMRLLLVYNSYEGKNVTYHGKNTNEEDGERQRNNENKENMLRKDTEKWMGLKHVTWGNGNDFVVHNNNRYVYYIFTNTFEHSKRLEGKENQTFKLNYKVIAGYTLCYAQFSTHKTE